ncbi:hypothetical protein [Lewinella sp. IMCC34191]|uniref:hypothetical protein n=1 Tax=Lewinella sp. IMCC34191 TaxID=2259172 RepID=UPI000E229D7F|nr:hypothetical protein [Lewinella sp. IMCC34191]
MPIDQVTALLFRRDFGLPATSLTEEELIDWLTAKVGEMMRYRPEQLMSLCYTLDLSEALVADALDPTASRPEPPFRTLARLLYERQCARARTKNNVTVRELDDPNAW